MRGRLVALVVLGFFAAWLAFGLAAHVADAARALGRRRAIAWFVANGWMVGAAVLAGAGLFQWSALKYRCLEACRTPFGFVAARWHGGRRRARRSGIGVDHGVFCVGCCWALMLMMFVVGVGSVGWMLGARGGDGGREEPAVRAGGCARRWGSGSSLRRRPRRARQRRSERPSRRCNAAPPRRTAFRSHRGRIVP